MFTETLEGELAESERGRDFMAEEWNIARAYRMGSRFPVYHYVIGEWERLGTNGVRIIWEWLDGLGAYFLRRCFEFYCLKALECIGWENVSYMIVLKLSNVVHCCYNNCQQNVDNYFNNTAHKNYCIFLRPQHSLSANETHSLTRAFSFLLA